MTNGRAALDALVRRRLSGGHAAFGRRGTWCLLPPPYASVAARIDPGRRQEAVPDRLLAPQTLAQNMVGHRILFRTSETWTSGQQERRERKKQGGRNFQQTQGRGPANAQQAQGRCRCTTAVLARWFADTSTSTVTITESESRSRAPTHTRRARASALRCGWDRIAERPRRLAPRLPRAVPRCLSAQGRHGGGVAFARGHPPRAQGRLGGADRGRRRLCRQDRRPPVGQSRDVAQRRAME